MYKYAELKVYVKNPYNSTFLSNSRPLACPPLSLMTKHCTLIFLVTTISIFILSQDIFTQVQTSHLVGFFSISGMLVANLF